MSDFTPRGQNRSELDRRLAYADPDHGSEADKWRAAAINVGAALSYALLDVADAIRDHAEGGYPKMED